MREGGSQGTVPLVEGEDFYMEHGLMVLTARYHLRRGYCCDQGCRHCPYEEGPYKKTESCEENE